MEKLHITVLEKNLGFLGENLNPDDVVNFLISKEVFRLKDFEELNEIASREKKVSTLISTLITRGDNAFPSFMEALEQYEHSKHIAKKLKEDEETERYLVKDSLNTNEASETKRKCLFRLPSDTESDEENDADEEQIGLTFEAFLELIGLKGKFPARLSLKEFVSVKDPKILDANTNDELVEVFWQNLSSLDYRARSTILIKQYCKLSPDQLSIKDFLFAVLHCSDMLLRQDILEKMSTCQLAVPVILQGVEGKKTELLSWSLRRIVKKWKDQLSKIHEQHIVKEPLFTTSFLRIGELKNISKSLIINHLLGPCQGNRFYPYFLTKEDDVCCAKFSSGCVECIWYLPVNSNGSEQLHNAMSVLNLRGDGTLFPHQTEFLCKASNLTVAFIATRNKDATEYEEIIDKINSTSQKCIFVAIDDDCDTVTAIKRKRKMRWVDNCLFVRAYEIGTLCDYICSVIKEGNEKCPTQNLKSIDQAHLMCGANIDVELNHKMYHKARNFISKIIHLDDKVDVSKFKEQSFPLQNLWKEWNDVDREQVKPDSEKEISVEFACEEIEGRKEKKRKLQLDRGLSETVVTFNRAIEEGSEDLMFLRYFMSYLQEELFRLTHENTKTHLQKIEQLEQKIEKLENLKRSKATMNDGTHVNINNDKNQEEDSHFQKKIEESKRLRKAESEDCRKKTLGWEHFLRELGQYLEAHVELKAPKTFSVAAIPNLAVKLLLNGYSLEIMDGDTGSVPLTWVTYVLRSLATELKNPSILVLSIVGVQSSGKSTLLNTLFGVRFPVRAGRCTRGLFLRMLTVDAQYVEKLRAEYIFIIDSEGIRSLEGTEKFDNELATLALCISDITIFNIGGEVLSPDMAGVLEIAAHALIRMKEVDLNSQCRIIQQNVSDLTASERNRVDMNHVIDNLNKATVEAAKLEGFGDRYQEFSDVFALRRDKDLQFIPSLWTKPMSPPNELYSQIVMRVKRDILRDIEKQQINPQFTVLTFTQRIRDVWAAVKDEKFLFNFHDSIKAVDFNNLCMEFNKWITEMRLLLIKKQVDWEKRLLEESNEKIDETLDRIKKECGEELCTLMKSIRSKFETLVRSHERKNNVEKYADWFQQNLEHTVSGIEHSILSVLQSEKINIKLYNDISSSGAKIKSKMREDIQLLAEECHKASESDSKNPAGDPDLLFSSKWEELMRIRQHEFFPPAMSEKSEKTMEAACEELLLSVTKDMAVDTEIHSLTTEEGGIKKHATINVPWQTYFPHKERTKHVEEWFQSNQDKINAVIHHSLQEMTEKGSQKRFDANLFQYILQNALQQLSSPYLTSEAPGRLKAKILLHICGKLFENVLKTQRAFEAKNSFQTFMQKEKEPLRTHFMALIKRGNQVDHGVKRLTRHLSESGKDVTLLCIRLELIQIFTVKKHWAIKPKINVSILEEVCKNENLEEFLSYISNHTRYVQNWANDKAVEICCENVNNQSQLNVIAQRAIDRLSSDLVSMIETAYKKVTEKCQSQSSQRDDNSLYKEWVQSFIQELVRRDIVTGHHELAVELNSFHISNLENFLHELKRKVVSSWKDNVYKELQIPAESSPQLMKTFLERNMPARIFRDVLSLTCLAQCPFCKATCDNPMPLGLLHKHTSSTHLPRGLSGAKNPLSLELIIDDCTVCVSSQTATYIVPGTNTKRLYKDYKADFPGWSIEPQDNVRNYSKFWKWVMTQFNRSLAAKYKCEPAQIPPRWRHISKKDALDSLTSTGSGISDFDQLLDLMKQFQSISKDSQ